MGRTCGISSDTFGAYLSPHTSLTHCPSNFHPRSICPALMIMAVLVPRRSQKLVDAFCERQGKAPNSVRFLFDGSRVQPTDSPDTLDMADGDTLEVHQEQIGGGI